MAQYSVKYREIINGKSYPGTNTTTVTASNIFEAKEAFKYNHTDTEKRKYVIVGVVQRGK